MASPMKSAWRKTWVSICMPSGSAAWISASTPSMVSVSAQRVCRRLLLDADHHRGPPLAAAAPRRSAAPTLHGRHVAHQNGQVLASDHQGLLDIGHRFRAPDTAEQKLLAVLGHEAGGSVGTRARHRVAEFGERDAESGEARRARQPPGTAGSPPRWSASITSATPGTASRRRRRRRRDPVGGGLELHRAVPVGGQAMNRISPMMEVTGARIGGGTSGGRAPRAPAASR
jgi:hypothetical protein